MISGKNSANRRSRGDEAPPSSGTDPRADSAALHPNEETSAQSGRDIADGASTTDPGTAVASASKDMILDKVGSRMAAIEVAHAMQMAAMDAFQDKMAAFEEKMARDFEKLAANLEKMAANHDANFEKLKAHSEKMEAMLVDLAEGRTSEWASSNADFYHSLTSSRGHWTKHPWR